MTVRNGTDGQGVDPIARNLFVEAGAGTGKTTALVARIIALVRAGVPIDRIVAITFTERAAAELKARVREGLEKARSEDPDRIDPALAALDRAQISTIHSFCRALLSWFSAEAGVDPDFKLLDDVALVRRREERWRAYLDDSAGDPGKQEAIDRALRVGMTTNEINRLVIAITEAPGFAAHAEQHPLAAQPVPWPDLHALMRMVEDTGYLDVSPDDALQQSLAKAANILQRLVSADEREREVYLAALTIPKPGKSGQLNNWPNGQIGKEAAASALEEVRQALQATLPALRARAVAGLLPVIIRFAREDDHARAREGELTFDDLIVRTQVLLFESPMARGALRERYDTMLIDEFQDTDPLQVSIANAFATDPATGQLEPGRLFLVGDPKQSIYRFRGADMAVFDAAHRQMEDAGSQFRELKTNRRSRREIIEWVNRIFVSVIGDGSDTSIQPAYRPIEHHREDVLRGPGIATFGEETPGPAPLVRENEARDIAALCRAIVDPAGWQVMEDERVRSARYGDIAILIPTRTNLGAMEESLRSAGVPFRVEGGSLIFRTQEIRDILNCLTAIDNPADEVAVVAALRSPAFACSDRDLAEFKLAGGRFSYFSRTPEGLAGPVVSGLSQMSELHRQRHDLSLAALVEELVGRMGLVETSILAERSRNGFRRARYMIDRAREYEASGPESLRSFVEWMEQQTTAQTYGREGADLDDDEDSVRIMTVHAAKGLEFPIVILAGMSSEPRNDSGIVLRDRSSGLYGIGFGGQDRRFWTSGYATLEAIEGLHAEAERKRVLYVAATRARDHLVVSLYRRGRGRNLSPAWTLFDAGAAEGVPQLHPGQPAVATGGLLSNLAVELEGEPDPERFAAERQQLVARAARRTATSATALNVGPHGAGADRKTLPEDESEPWSRGRARTRVGRAVHATIQSLPFNADDDTIAAFSRAQAVAEAIPHLASEVEDAVRWIVSESAAWRRARSSKRCLREVPFAMETGDMVLEGFIDLVVDGEDGLEIIDWKTDRITAREVQGRLQEYRLQAGLYVHGLRTATGLPVAKVTYVFANARAEESPGTPDELAADALATLEATA